MKHPDDGKSAMSKSEFPENNDPSIGYRNPPMVRRFKGEPFGNPPNKSGRPKGSKNRKTMVREIAHEMHAVTESGRKRRRSTLELILLKLRNKALTGNVRAYRAYCEFLEKYEPQNVGSDLGFMVAPAEMTQEEWIAAEMQKNLERQRSQGP